MSAATAAGPAPDVEGWLTDAQAARLAAAAGAVAPGGRVVEIGSFRGRSTIALARAAPDGAEVVAIDPHLGRDRAPQQRTEDADVGATDAEAFHANLVGAGVADRVRHVRRRAEDALGEVAGPVDVLYVDGAHSFARARFDLTRWGDRVAPAGTMLVHDSFSSVGVTLALLRVTFFGRRWRYDGRTRSLAAFHRASLSGGERWRNAARQAAELPWFARNLAVKALIVARLRPLARLLGHRDGAVAVLGDRAEPPELHGVARVRQLWTLFRREVEDPWPFYTVLAREAAADLDRRYGPLAGQRIVDLGSGPGYYARAFRRLGSEVIPVDNSDAELRLAGEPPEGAILADAGDLPLADACVDGAFASNLLEHTPNTPEVIAEIERVLRPGGWAYISWTNWYSPWGGHDMSPYHLLGPRLGPRLYQRRHGPPRKNAYGEDLWAVHVGPTIRLVRRRPGLEIEAVEPRYWPRLSAITRVPGLREVATWNCVIRVRRR